MRKPTNINQVQILYVLQNGNTNQYKIGITDNLNRRIKQLQTGCPEELKIITVWYHSKRNIIEKYEKTLHRYFTKCGCRIRPKGEWFELCKPDIYNLCKPNSIAEQNEFIQNILKMM